MAVRQRGRLSRLPEEEPRPELSAVLDHYNIQYRTDRVNQKILCPVHEERVPSCSVQINKGLWMCHSCGKGGDSYTLIMLREEVDFGGARTFASTLGLTEGDTGARNDEVSGSAFGGRHRVPSRSRDNKAHGGYVPAWKRG